MSLKVTSLNMVVIDCLRNSKQYLNKILGTQEILRQMEIVVDDNLIRPHIVYCLFFMYTLTLNLKTIFVVLLEAM